MPAPRFFRRALVLLAVASIGTAIAPAVAHAAAAHFTTCGQNGLACTTVTVPIDRAGGTPGTIPLYVERLQSDGLPRGVLFLVAGGPGQPSAGAFDLGANAAEFRSLFAGYTLVAFDNRGTGKSGLINCPRLQSATSVTTAVQAQLAAECAASIGPTFPFYATRDHVEDMEAVRQALGVDRIAIWGTSYGTKLAIAYALAHPTHVERMILDSVLPEGGPDPLATEVLKNMPRGLASLCNAGTCNGATPNVTADVAALANRLAAHPLTGKVRLPKGSRSVRVDGLALLSAVLDTDLNPGLGAEIPAAVHAALRGSPQPLLRVVDWDQRASITPASDLSFGLLAATTCDDGRFPWAPDTPVAARQALLDAARSRLPAGSTGPFGLWATEFGSAALCVRWPSPSGGAPLAVGPLPDVPVLIFAGDRDLRTPIANAFAMASRFRQAQLVVVPGSGHSVLTTDYTGCADAAVATWLAGGTPPGVCPRIAPYVAPLAAFPRSIAAAAPLGAPGLRGRTVTAAVRTVREAGATWTILLASGPNLPASAAGVYGGLLRPGKNSPGFTLVRYSAVPGVELSGSLALDRGIFRAVIPFRFIGSVTVRGAKAVRGELSFSGTSVTGVLGGRKIRARI